MSKEVIVSPSSVKVGKEPEVKTRGSKKISLSNQGKKKPIQAKNHEGGDLREYFQGSLNC